MKNLSLLIIFLFSLNLKANTLELKALNLYGEKILASEIKKFDFDHENKLNLIELLNGQVIDRYEVLSGEFSHPVGGEKILSPDSFNKSMFLERFVGGDGSGGG